MGKSIELGMFVCKPRKGLFLSVYVDHIELAGKKQNMDNSRKFGWDLDGKKYRIGNVDLFIENCSLIKCSICSYQ